jgi:uncharacterized membrane protein YjjP (DUF1212 family)
MSLVRAMHMYGAPVHRLEATYDHVCKGQAVEGVLLAEPTSLVAIVEERGEQLSRVSRMGPSGFDLGRWASVEELAQALGCRDVSLDEAMVSLAAVASRRDPFSGAVVLGAHACVAGTAVGFLGGGWPEVVVATLIGACVGAMALWVSRAPSWSGVFEAGAGMVAGMLASMLLPVLGPGSVAVATTAGLIGLVPGFTLTLAMTEIATHHLSSGTARLASAAGTFLALGFGVAIGGRVGAAWAGEVPLAVCMGLPEVWRWFALGAGGCALGILFGASRRDLLWALLGACVADFGARVGGHWLGDEGAALCGALSVGLAANSFSRVFNRPAALVEVPGIMVLVPGSVGLRSLTALLSRDVVTGIEVGVSMMMTAAALVVGSLLANVLVPPRGRH